MNVRKPLGVLLVEDDPVLREVLALHLAAEGWAVRAVADGNQAIAESARQMPDVVLLDLSLPGCSGLEVCAWLRTRTEGAPGVLMITARASEAEVLLGFDAGADDYVIKPCRPREVISRVRALARRVRPEPSPREALIFGLLRIDTRATQVFVGAREVKLTATEFTLLLRLASEPGKALSRLILLREVWEIDHEGYARNVDCHVARLRRKLEAHGLLPSPIVTVHGKGYRFVAGEPA